MTKDRYLVMCDQMGTEPIESEIPPDHTDLPFETQQAIHIFNTLGDRIVAEVGYLGKDYTLLPQLIKIYEIEDEELLVESLHLLDSRAIKKSQEEMKKHYDKLKRK